MTSHSGPASTSIRIIGGRWRSRRLNFQPVAQLRPTANRIRETLFNWLQDRVEGETCLDLFAGSGACGIEALSRGAGQTLFVEKHPQAVKDIGANLDRLGADNGRVKGADVLVWLRQPEVRPDGRYGIVFVDPPYDDNLELECCRLLEESALLKADALIYLETDKLLVADQIPLTWRIHRQKKAGAVHYYLFQREG